jgi:hypothetical protein
MKYSVREAKEEMKNGFRAYMQKNENGEYCLNSVNRIPFYLEGAPGIGKTEIVRQAADELEIGFVSFSITHHTRNSLLGLPVISNLDCGKYTEYTMSEIIAAVVERVEAGETEGVLLLDEFNCASETIMPTMLAFLQTRNIGKYRLPDGWNIVLCGNPTTYNRNAKQFDAVILDRVRRLEVEFEIKDFLEYANENKFHDSIIEYLKIHKHNLYRCTTEKNKEETVTCRGWENLSHTIKMYESLGQEINEKLIGQYIKSVEVAHSFFDFYWMFRGKIGHKELGDILSGKQVKKYVEIVANESFEFRWKLAGQLLNHIRAEAALDAKKKTSAAWEAHSEKISKAIRFLNKLQEPEILLERFFKEVNQDQLLVTILSKIENKDYIKLCRKACGELEIIDKCA